ncbi:protein of unknown function [Pseudomonas sp. JV241A]|nr:protein of unknown function [Pseudomonas sp. JV241A]
MHRSLADAISRKPLSYCSWFPSVLVERGALFVKNYRITIINCDFGRGAAF